MVERHFVQRHFPRSLKPATGTTSWTYALALAAPNLASGDNYTVISQATDSAGNVGTSSTVTFTYNTTAPTVTVTYPVTSTIYGTDWSGSITGSASSTAGTSVSGTAVAVKNTTTGNWWNGTSFAATSLTYEPATGATSWTYALTASENFVSGDNYSVTGQATDSAGNIGTSSPVTFTYNTTAPSVAITYPVSGTTRTGPTGLKDDHRDFLDKLGGEHCKRGGCRREHLHKQVVERHLLCRHFPHL